jgi:hypothetical protein
MLRRKTIHQFFFFFRYCHSHNDYHRANNRSNFYWIAAVWIRHLQSRVQWDWWWFVQQTALECGLFDEPGKSSSTLLWMDDFVVVILKYSPDFPVIIDSTATAFVHLRSKFLCLKPSHQEQKTAQNSWNHFNAQLCNTIYFFIVVDWRERDREMGVA